MSPIQLFVFLSILFPLSSLAQIFLLHPPNTTRVVSTDFSIDCTIIASETTIQWTKDGNVLSPSSSSYEILSVSTSTGLSSHFHIFSGVFSNTGVYTCLAYSGSNLLEHSYPGTLTMAGPVHYLENPTDQVVYLNQPIILICHIQGGPLPTLKWTYDVTEGTIDVVPGGLISIITNRINSYETSSTLTITSAQLSHDSTYHCETENSYGTADRTARITVQNQELQSVSITQPTDGASYTLIAYASNSISLPCTAAGLPKPTLQWTVPASIQTANVRINEATQIPVLHIAAPTLQDAGIYTCIANNTLTADTASIEVIVVEIPVVSASSDATINAGSSVTLFCSATGTPTPTVTLTHPNNSALGLDQSGLVTLSVTTYRDEGTYSCVASVHTVSAESSFVVTVLSEPVFVTPPSDTGVGIGQDVTFSCIVTGSPQPTLIWIYNNYTVLSAPIPSNLRISNVHSTDQGMYTCMATNVYGSINASATLSIFPIPQFVITPATTLAAIGESVQLYCSASPVTATIEWYVADTMITAGIKYFTTSDGSLTIYNLELSDTNSYTCRISNPAGMLDATAILTVIQRPYFRQTPTDVTVSPGTQVTFSCAVSGTPIPTLSWVEGSNGGTIQTGGKFTVSLGASTITLTISNVALGEAGDYTCVAKNGLEARSSARLSIISVPQVAIVPNIQQATLGLQFIMTCVVIYSVPAPAFQWYKDSVLLTTDARLKSFTNGSLVFDIVIQGDEGDYLCIAINSEGTDSAGSRVDVIIRPSFVSTPTRQYVNLDTDISIPCYSDGVPTPLTSWLFYDNTAIPNNEHYTWTLQANGPLMIANALGSDHGNFTCVTTNDAGTAYLTIFLTVRIPPSVPTNLSAVVTNATNVVLTWRVPFNGYSSITGYSVMQQIMGGNSEDSVIFWWNLNVTEGQFDTAVVTSLIPYEFYRFQVAGMNTIGLSGYSVQSEYVQLFPSYPPAPENVTTRALNSSAILVTWLPPTYSHGVLQYYVISWGLAGGIAMTTPPIPASEELQFLFTSLSIYTEYMFSVRAFNTNPIGGTFSGSLSAPVYQYTGEEPPIGPPLNVNLTSAPGGIYVEWDAPLFEFRQGLIIAYNLLYRESLLNLAFPTLPPYVVNQSNHSEEAVDAYRRELMEYYRFGNKSYTVLSIPVQSDIHTHSFILGGLQKEEYYFDVKLHAVNTAGVGPNSTVQSVKSGKNVVNLVAILVPSIVGPLILIACVVSGVISVLLLRPTFLNWRESATHRKGYRESGSARRPLVAPKSSLQESNIHTENRGFDDIIRKPIPSASKRDSPLAEPRDESYLAAINEINRQIMQSVGDSEQELNSDYSNSASDSGSMSGINTDVFIANKPTDSPHNSAKGIYNYDSIMPKVGEEKKTTKQTDFDDVVGDTIREAPVLHGMNYSDDDDDDDRLSDSQTPADFYPHENSDLSDDERVTYADYIKNLSADPEAQPQPESESSLAQYSHISFEFTKAKREVANLKMEDKKIKLEKKRLDQEKKLREKIALKERKAREMRAKSGRKEREREAKQRLKERQQSYIPSVSLQKENKNRDVLF